MLRVNPSHINTEIRPLFRHLLWLGDHKMDRDCPPTFPLPAPKAHIRRNYKSSSWSRPSKPLHSWVYKHHYKAKSQVEATRQERRAKPRAHLFGGSTGLLYEGWPTPSKMQDPSLRSRGKQGHDKSGQRRLGAIKQKTVNEETSSSPSPLHHKKDVLRTRRGRKAVNSLYEG